MTVHLPVWHSDCTRARFAVLVSRSDELVSARFPAKVGCEVFVWALLLLVFVV